MDFTTSASLVESPILTGITNFGIQCQLFIIKYLTIKHWWCNCQKQQIFTSGPFISILHISFQLFYLASHHSFLILSQHFYLILSYLLVLNHLALNLDNSHNILRKNWEARIKFLYFVQLAGAKRMFGSVCIAVFARLILTCHIL